MGSYPLLYNICIMLEGPGLFLRFVFLIFVAIYEDMKWERNDQPQCCMIHGRLRRMLGGYVLLYLYLVLYRPESLLNDAG